MEALVVSCALSCCRSVSRTLLTAQNCSECWVRSAQREHVVLPLGQVKRTSRSHTGTKQWCTWVVYTMLTAALFYTLCRSDGWRFIIMSCRSVMVCACFVAAVEYFKLTEFCFATSAEYSANFEYSRMFEHALFKLNTFWIRKIFNSYVQFWIFTHPLP